MTRVLYDSGEMAAECLVSLLNATDQIKAIRARLISVGMRPTFDAVVWCDIAMHDLLVEAGRYAKQEDRTP